MDMDIISTIIISTTVKWSISEISNGEHSRLFKALCSMTKCPTICMLVRLAMAEKFRLLKLIKKELP